MARFLTLVVVAEKRDNERAKNDWEELENFRGWLYGEKDIGDALLVRQPTTRFSTLSREEAL